MKNKTIANWLIASFGVCLLGAMMPDDSQWIFFSIGGIGLIVFTIISVIRLLKINKQHWLAYALCVNTFFYIVGALSGGLDTAVGQLSVIGYWVLGIWAIVRLYQTTDIN